MKLFLLSSALLVTLVAATDCWQTVCQGFAVHAGASVTFAVGADETTIVGDVGTSPGISITGIENTNLSSGLMEIASAEESAAFVAGKSEAEDLAFDAANEVSMSLLSSAEIGGETFTEGQYISLSFISITSDLILDGQGDTNAYFFFRTFSTLTTAANTNVILTNGASAENIIWQVDSSATLGANSVLQGSIDARSSVTVGVGAQVNGCIIAASTVSFAGGGGAVLETQNPNCNAALPPASSPTSSRGDPHFRTWKNEHFEYHGQCDLVLAKDQEFADGVGLDVQIRTKLVRFWSYIKQAAVRIGDDILEIEGSADPTEIHYWINSEYKGELKTIGGFPVTTFVKESSPHQRFFEIDLSSKYPGVKIVLGTYKEFVSVDFVNSSEEAFGKTVGLFGDFKTGKTFARDGFTVLDDFTELGHEWQVLPAEVMIFHDMSEPQFPQMCIDPEDPRGERRRRLDESFVTEEQAEEACARIPDAADRKDCVYDILATQDIDMVGAY